MGVWSLFFGYSIDVIEQVGGFYALVLGWSARTLQKHPNKKGKKSRGAGQQEKICSTLSLLRVSLGCFRMCLTVFPLVTQNICKVVCWCTPVFQATVKHKRTPEKIRSETEKGGSKPPEIDSSRTGSRETG